MENQETTTGVAVESETPANDSVISSSSQAIDSSLESIDSPPMIKVDTPTRKLPLKPVGSHSPDRRRYNLLYQELKVKYRNQSRTIDKLNSALVDQQQKFKSSEDKCKYLQDENEKLKQLIEQEKMDIALKSNDNIDSVNTACTDNLCMEDDNKQKLECKECKKFFHYQCTNLPAYQIAHFLTTPNYRKFICVNCTVIPDTIQKDLRNDRSNRRQLKESSSNENGTITSLKTFISDKMSDISSHIKEIIDSKFLESSKDISTLNENLIKVQRPIIENDDSDQLPKDSLWSTVVSKPKNIKILMREAKNDERVEEHEREKRSKNIIIHGAEEVGESPEEIKNEDAQYISEILNKIGSPVEPTLVTRLGKKSEGRSRPIKVVLKNKADKNIIMKNLVHLKGTERYFGKISVKDDYTTQERENIRLLTETAKAQSIENPTRVFKVRGDSKNGWKVVSFPRK